MGKTRECRPPSPPAPVGRARGAGKHVTDDNTNGIGNHDGKHIECGGDAASTTGRGELAGT